ncbi:MAG: DNA/RNA helicase domain-containing protein [Candidatus Nanopelagicales bacterium]
MSLLRLSAEGLRASAVEQALVQTLEKQFQFSMGHRPSAGEMRSWSASLPVLAQDLCDAGLQHVEVLVEHRLPLSSKRIDAVLAGVHPSTGRPSYVVVELKQWTHAQPFEDTDDLVRIDAYGNRPVLHPLEQVRRYVQFLEEFTRSLEQERDALVGAAYLHNGDERDLGWLRDAPETAKARLFTKSGRGAWIEFLQSRLAPQPGRIAADQLLSSRIAPSRQLLSVAAAEIKSREQFVLLDEQQVAYSLVLRAVEKARAGNGKTVVLVTGGPGSGKSVIALSLLGELSRRGYATVHATGSKAFTETLRRVAGKGSSQVKSLFLYFNSFMDANPNDLDVLISDEAHRIRETSANRYTPARLRTGAPQIDELVDAARVPVFLLDEHQVVRPGEIGSVDVVIKAAQDRGIPVERVDLDAQFRSGGSRAYEHWVLRLLHLEPGGPIPWEGDEHFELQVADSPEHLEQMLALKQSDGATARMTAGFCWPWNDAANGRLADDVVIGDWKRPWNNKEERKLGGIPARSLWASEPGGFGQVGCVYTAQGFEYDWNGVILGPDLVWRGDRFVSDVSASKDPAFRGKNAAGFDAYVRNIYKVLLTRGMQGTVVYSTDAETRAKLRDLIG